MSKLQRIFTLVAVVTAIYFPAKSVAISIHCIAVGPAGEDTITWDNAGTNAIDFRSWHIYHSTAAVGPFSLIDSVNIFAATSYIDMNANAITNPAYYFIVFESNNGTPAVYSDTVRAINLNLNNPGSGYANLSWNVMHVPLIPTHSPYYVIYRQFTGGPFIAIDSIDARTAPIPMSYSDLVSVCDDTIKYYIEVRDSTGCISRSPVKGDRFFDLQAPAFPVIDSVSVDASGNATVTWQQSASPDADTYIVLQLPGPIAVDTLTGISNTTLVTTISAQTGSKSFIVIAVDSCNNPSAPSVFHSTIFLQISFDECEKSTTLSWNPYTFWGGSLGYDVLASINGGPEIVIGSTTQTSFTDTALVSGAVICYRIRAIEVAGTRTSTSNQVCMTPVFTAPPSFSYIRSVTVLGDDQVYVEAFVDSVPFVTGYLLKRSLDSLGPFTTVATINVTGVSSITFSDNPDTETGPYYYQVTTIDSCGLEVINSQVSSTILLSGVANSDFTNSLNWTPYSDWPGGVDHYDIYIRINGVLSFFLYSVLPDSMLGFLDDVMNNFESDGELCYVVEAIEATGNPFSFSDTSRSNEVCLIQQPVIFIPNAFHPGGVFNETFQPSNSLVSAEGYSLTIFNRWGEVVFETNDPSIGWDGTLDGKHVPESVYVYLLKAKNPDGNEFRKVGSVTLIR